MCTIRMCKTIKDLLQKGWQWGEFAGRDHGPCPELEAIPKLTYITKNSYSKVIRRHLQ